MLKIRLTRRGTKKVPFYRIVVMESSLPQSGRPADTIGYYDSAKEPAVLELDEEKALAWMAKGAQPTDTVRALFRQKGIMAKFAEMKK